MAYKETYQTVSKKDQAFLDLALKTASLSECVQRHGAVVVKSGRVMALGINKMKNDPRWIHFGERGSGTVFSVHAEIDALRKVANPEGAVVYIARLGKGGATSYSRPCARCAKALAKAGVKEVCFT